MNNGQKRQISLTRIAKDSSAGIVASIAGYASYWHQVAVAQIAGERDELAHIIPLSVDGVLVVASIAMVDARREGRKPSWQTRLGFIVGIAASIGANVMSAHPTILGRAVAAWPALALLLVVEMLSSKGKRRKDADPIAEMVRVTPEPVQEAQQVVQAEVSRLPVPVSPAPRVAPEVRTSLRGREVISPLTGRVLTERPPKV
jgi:hypothetical protein